MSATVVTGVGIQMVRLRLWVSAANLAQKGIKASSNSTIANWRAQTGSKATRWHQVAAEAAKMHDDLVEWAARVKRRELRLRTALSQPEQLSDARQILYRMQADRLAAVFNGQRD